LELPNYQGETIVIQKVVILIVGAFFLFLSGTVMGETSMLVNVQSLAVVLGGTVFSALLAFPLKTLEDLIKSLRKVFQHKETDHHALIRCLERLARAARLHGVKALEAEGRDLENDFLRKGVELVADGYDQFEIRNIMEKEYELYFSWKESQITILDTMAKLAPVFGFLGTIMGLVEVLGNLGDPAQIGKGMALALLTTFYGLMFANFLFMPMSKKLSEHIKAEATVLSVIVEALMGIAEQKNARGISHRLQSYLNINQTAQPPATSTRPEKPDSGIRIPFGKLVMRRHSG
jgi:chemotaxis protein MotA